ncbi:uncharacterized protein LOC129944638 [Eupeodes corollae]|uniref:uncharacterized protein LOC129944638 n=1 Tax=Eupeodes corollae TaxID=290404 RepID=UPI0024917051|nr:uncharacterized protein LOC129944638 [Eupeodes corollae]
MIQIVLEDDLKLELNRHDFAYIASVINAVFPSEAKEEYYSPAINGQKASGELYDTFANYRNLLSSTGLINRRSKKSSRDLDSTIVNVCDDNCEAFKFIQEYNEPFDEVLENWKRSFAVRWNILEDNKVETADYLAKFPICILNNSNIFKLFLEDSKMLHPDIALNIDWQICNKVLENGSHLKDPTVKKWITASLNCSEENRKAIGLLVLPYLFPSTKIKARQGKQSFKASKLEIQEKFILYFETLGKADDFERQLLNSNVGLQPRIIFVGELNCLKAYVTLTDKKYAFENPLDAVQQCFYMYQALHIKYPAESTSVWTFIQIYIFNVKTKFDQVSSSIKSIWRSLKK